MKTFLSIGNQKPFLLILGITLLAGCAPKPKGASQPSAFEFKEKLSDYGFFASPIGELHPQAALAGYELATPLFTDYAIKDRFILLPKGKSARYTGPGLLDFPDSTIILKTFSYVNEQDQRVRIETRMLVKNPADHQWMVMNYLWNPEQTEANRLIVGAKLPISLKDESGNLLHTVYQVPNTNDCKRCHISHGTLTPIGPKTKNMNLVKSGEKINQLEHWRQTGIVVDLPPIETIDQFPDWKDKDRFTLDQRARAYLDVNCAHCHSPGGDASNTGLFLEYDQKDVNHLGIMKEPVSAGGGAGGLNYNIIPGDAKHSILAYRMNSTVPGTAMPELARTITHKEGVALIVEWINKMPKI